MPEDPALARISTVFPSEILTVSQLSRSLRDLVERRYPLLWVQGEISSCTVARSGHAYFVLKDSEAQIRCVMFRSRGSQLGWAPRDGMQVEARGLLTLYEARGDIQLVVETMRLGGRGALYDAFVRLKEKLQAEGLFAEASKRPIPFLPKAIGIVTSLHAAALSDVLTTLRRRNPSIPVIIYPTPVQGLDAAPRIVQALAHAGRRQECDVIVLCRGGGSIEDLWSFNDESLARAVRACPVPVVCGVGHETDFTIADFAADRRAPTPTAAAELVSPARAELLQRAATLGRRLQHMTSREMDSRAQAVDYLSRRLSHPSQRIAEQSRLLAHLRLRLARSLARELGEHAWRASGLLHRMIAMQPRMQELSGRVRIASDRLAAASLALHAGREARVASIKKGLEHLSPLRVLERGYSLVRDASGRVVADGSTLRPGDRIDVKFARGSAKARVDSAAG